MRLFMLLIIIILVGCVFWLRIRMQIDRGLDTPWYKMTGIAKTKPDHWLFTILRATKDDPNTMWFTLLRELEGGTAIPYEPNALEGNTTDTSTATTPDEAPQETSDQQVADAKATADSVLGIPTSGSGTSRVQCVEGKQTQYMTDNNIKVMNCYATAAAATS